MRLLKFYLAILLVLATFLPFTAALPVPDNPDSRNPSKSFLRTAQNWSLNVNPFKRTKSPSSSSSSIADAARRSSNWVKQKLGRSKSRTPPGSSTSTNISQSAMDPDPNPRPSSYDSQGYTTVPVIQNGAAQTEKGPIIQNVAGRHTVKVVNPTEIYQPLNANIVHDLDEP
ncbi:hypothetical protein H0H93_008910 [Arthromyces matolae]|nr:hypothetical protein H0H93_008910 [Arthromyces matolae]